MRRGKSYEIFTDLNQMLTKNLRICTTVSVPILKSESCANTISICWSTSVNLRIVSSKDDLRLHFSELLIFREDTKLTYDHIFCRSTCVDLRFHRPGQSQAGSLVSPDSYLPAPSLGAHASKSPVQENSCIGARAQKLVALPANLLPSCDTWLNLLFTEGICQTLCFLEIKGCCPDKKEEEEKIQACGMISIPGG